MTNRRIIVVESCNTCQMKVGEWCPNIQRYIGTVADGKIHYLCKLPKETAFQAVFG